MALKPTGGRVITTFPASDDPNGPVIALVESTDPTRELEPVLLPPRQNASNDDPPES